MGHIDPSTGRNKRETGKLAKRFARYDAAYASGSGRPKSGAIRMSAGRPIEKRVEQKRRNRLYPPGGQRR
jgi:hypothetical protein